MFQVSRTPPYAYVKQICGTLKDDITGLTKVVILKMTLQFFLILNPRGVIMVQHEF